MMHELRIRSRALREIHEALQEYKPLDHHIRLQASLEFVFETLRRMPRRFPKIDGSIHRALLRNYPFAVFFRIRAETVVVLAVLHQRRDPSAWPK